MIIIRVASESDAWWIREIFEATYGERIFAQGSECAETFVVLDGEVEIQVEGYEDSVGSVGPGECLGEVALLTDSEHSASAVASTDVQATVLQRSDLTELVRQRPDIGVVLYRNLARGLGEKLRRADLKQVKGFSEVDP